MLLEMIPDMPDCAEDFLGWQPLSYREHFTASNFKARDLAIAAYDLADPGVRAEFDNLTATMTSILTAVGAAMREARQDKTRATLAEQATGWVKPLVALAGGIINGRTTARGRRRLHHDPLIVRDAGRAAVPPAARRQRRHLPRRQDSAGAPRPLPGQGLLFAARAAGSNSANRCMPPCIARSTRKPR